MNLFAMVSNVVVGDVGKETRACEGQPDPRACHTETDGGGQNIKD